MVLALSSLILKLQDSTNKAVTLAEAAESRGDFTGARVYHLKQTRLVQQRHRRIDHLCLLPATTPATRRAKAEAFMTLVAVNAFGFPDQPEDWPLWSALKDLAASWSDAADPSSPT